MSTGAPTLIERHLPTYRQGNRTRLGIDAPVDATWAALHRLRARDLRATGVLMAVRSFPATVVRRGALDRATSAGERDATLLDSFEDGRFCVLDEAHGEEIVFGVIGQFWRIDGGRDARIDDAEAFRRFDRPGYVKAAINFRVDATSGGCVASTETRCLATDPATDRRFGRYWAVIGGGSKLIRWEVLHATRRLAEQRDR